LHPARRNPITRGQKKKMTSPDAQRFASLLQAKQREITGSLVNRNEIVIEKASDDLDQVQLMRERESAIRNLDRNSKALREVRQALSRIADGSYGVCLHCEEDIMPKRLAAVPWAAFCIKCQERMDRNEIEVEETVDLLAPAA
jgi:DnaK suppressor protein